MPSLYVCGALQPFSEQTDSGLAHHPGQRGAGGGAGIEASAIIASLAEMAMGGVPAALQARIKAWSRHFGSATIQTLILVQFRDQETLDELLQDPALARLLAVPSEAKLGWRPLRRRCRGTSHRTADRTRRRDVSQRRGCAVNNLQHLIPCG